MNQTELLPVIAGLLASASVLGTVTFEPHRTKHIWALPASISLFFLLITVQAAVSEGPFGFWVEHTRNLWGNQIWCDLLLGVSAAIIFLAPRARAMKMNIAPWTIACFATGTIGLYAFISRLLFLESRVGRDREESEKAKA